MLFAEPEALWLLFAAAAFSVGFARLRQKRRRDLQSWVDRRLATRLAPGWGRSSGRELALLTAAMVLLIAALAGPRWGEREEIVERRGVDIVFVLDTSLSMATSDVEPNRFWVAQTLIRKMLRSAAQHRAALVQMEGESVVQVPLTLDGSAVELMLDAVRIASLPLPGTDFGAALEQALGLLPETSSAHPVLVILSDGEDHGESGAAQKIGALKDRGVVVHAIGVGTPEGKALELPRQDPSQQDSGAPVQYKRDAEGRIVVSRLMEESLQRLASETGGTYLRASSPAVEIDPITEQIERMETGSFGAQRVDRLAERFQWPTAAAAILLALALFFGPHEHRGSDEVWK